jgi:hypothetical protein
MRARRTLCKSRGQAAIMVTLSLPVTLGLLALVVDLGWSYWRAEACKTAAQAAATAAVAGQAGVTTIACGSNNVACTANSTTYAACPSSPSSPPTDNLQAGCLYAQANGFTAGGNSSRQNVRYAAYTSGSPVHGVSPSYWARFVVAEKIPSLFSAVLGQSWSTVSGASTGAVILGAGACVYALGHTSTVGITLSGGTNVQALCGVWDNSISSGSSLSCSNNTTLNAGTNKITLDGGNGCGGTVSPAPLTNQPQAADPFASLPTPSDMNRCDSTGVTQNSTITMPADGVYEICNGGISMNSNGNLTLPAGLYYLKGGTLSWQNGTISGTGVTIFLTGAVSSISINGNMVVNISAPLSGPYAGVVIYQDRTLASPPNHTINGGSSMNFQGSIYLPGSYVKYAGGNGTTSTALVADTIDFTGNTNFGSPNSGNLTGLPTTKFYMIE